MGAALFIALETEIPNLDSFINGKSLSKAEPELRKIALEIGVEHLLNFYGADDTETAQEIYGDAAAIDLTKFQVKWYDAREGLKTVTALLKYCKENGSAIRNETAVIKDLKDLERILLEAKRQSVRWHLEVDY
jgi:hypothetical protein